MQVCRMQTWVAALLLGAAVAPAQAADWSGHVAAGYVTSIGGESSAVYSLGAEWPWAGRRWFDGELSIDATLMSIEGRPDTGRDLHRDVQALAVGLRWRRNGWLLGFSPALATARTDAISGTLQFLTTAGHEWRRVGLYLQHLSNASTNGDNIGETMLLVEWRFGGAD